MKTKSIIVATLITILISSCNNTPTEEKQVENDLIKITKEQFEAEKMAFGAPEQILMEDKISFTGKIVPSLNGIFKISAPVEGIIQTLHVQIGQEVKVNENLLEIGGNALVDLQQAYASSSAKIKQLESDYKRAKALYKENIKSENEYLLIESKYKSELANYKGLRIKLQYIGLNLSNIENGNYASTYYLKSPISGQISNLSVLSGQFIKSDQDIIELVNKDKIELQLAFFEKDYSKVRKGQNVRFGNMGGNPHQAKAIINRIACKLSSKSNTFECYATINKGNKQSYAINQLVGGEVILASYSVFALPKSAVFALGTSQYIILKSDENNKNYNLQKLKVEIGKSDKNYIEIKNAPKGKTILIKGTYNISIE